MKYKPKDYYVYVHRKATTGEVFYVGKGCGNRYSTPRSYNKFWTRVCEKHGYTSEIVLDGLQEWYAIELEISLIAYYGRRDLGSGTLVNLTDGGDGTTHNSPELIEKRRRMMKGNKYLLGKRHSDETKKKISVAGKNRRQTKEHSKKIALALKGKPKSKEHIENIRKAALKRPATTRKHLRKPILCSNGMVFDGVISAAKWLFDKGLAKSLDCRNNISNVARGFKKCKSAYGFTWRYLTTESKDVESVLPINTTGGAND